MVDSFNAIKYTTSYGENCIATKNNGVVTIQGDKNGVRQMSEKEFMECFVKDQAKATLERSPKQDTVSFSSNPDKAESANTKNKKGWLIGIGAGIGATALATGIYFLTRGKVKSVKKPTTIIPEAPKSTELKFTDKEIVNEVNRAERMADLRSKVRPDVLEWTEDSVTKVGDRTITRQIKPGGEYQEIIETPKYVATRRYDEKGHLEYYAFDRRLDSWKVGEKGINNYHMTPTKNGCNGTIQISECVGEKQTKGLNLLNTFSRFKTLENGGKSYILSVGDKSKTGEIFKKATITTPEYEQLVQKLKNETIS